MSHLRSQPIPEPAAEDWERLTLLMEETENAFNPVRLAAQKSEEPKYFTLFFDLTLGNVRNIIETSQKANNLPPQSAAFLLEYLHAIRRSLDEFPRPGSENWEYRRWARKQKAESNNISISQLFFPPYSDVIADGILEKKMTPGILAALHTFQKNYATLLLKFHAALEPLYLPTFRQPKVINDSLLRARIRTAGGDEFPLEDFLHQQVEFVLGRPVSSEELGGYIMGSFLYSDTPGDVDVHVYLKDSDIAHEPLDERGTKIIIDDQEFPFQAALMGAPTHEYDVNSTFHVLVNHAAVPVFGKYRVSPIKNKIAHSAIAEFHTYADFIKMIGYKKISSFSAQLPPKSKPNYSIIPKYINTAKEKLSSPSIRNNSIWFLIRALSLLHHYKPSDAYVTWGKELVALKKQQRDGKFPSEAIASKIIQIENEWDRMLGFDDPLQFVRPLVIYGGFSAVFTLVNVKNFELGPLMAVIFFISSFVTFYGSIVLHELGHFLAAKSVQKEMWKKGKDVFRTLSLILLPQKGVPNAALKVEPSYEFALSPAQYKKIIFWGPVSSLIGGLVFGLLILVFLGTPASHILMAGAFVNAIYFSNLIKIIPAPDSLQFWGVKRSEKLWKELEEHYSLGSLESFGFTSGGLSIYAKTEKGIFHIVHESDYSEENMTFSFQPRSLGDEAEPINVTGKLKPTNAENPSFGFKGETYHVFEIIDFPAELLREKGTGVEESPGPQNMPFLMFVFPFGVLSKVDLSVWVGFFVLMAVVNPSFFLPMATLKKYLLRRETVKKKHEGVIFYEEYVPVEETVYQVITEADVALLSTLPKDSSQVYLPHEAYPVLKEKPGLKNGEFALVYNRDRHRYLVGGVLGEDGEEVPLGDFLKSIKESHDKAIRGSDYRFYAPTINQWSRVREADGLFPSLIHDTFTTTFNEIKGQESVDQVADKRTESNTQARVLFRVKAPSNIPSFFSQVEVWVSEKSDWLSYPDYEAYRRDRAALPKGLDVADYLTRRVVALEGTTHDALTGGREQTGIVFLPGAGVGHEEEWWLNIEVMRGPNGLINDFKIRKYLEGGRMRFGPHEGIDILLLQNEFGDIVYINPGTKIRPIAPGTVVGVHDDVMGQTVIVRHEDINNKSGDTFYSYYTHITPQVKMGDTVHLDSVVGTIYDPGPRWTGAPPHLHLSLGWIPQSFENEYQRRFNEVEYHSAYMPYNPHVGPVYLANVVQDVEIKETRYGMYVIERPNDKFENIASLATSLLRFAYFNSNIRSTHDVKSSGGILLPRGARFEDDRLIDLLLHLIEETGHKAGDKTINIEKIEEILLRLLDYGDDENNYVPSVAVEMMAELGEEGQRLLSRLTIEMGKIEARPHPYKNFHLLLAVIDAFGRIAPKEDKELVNFIQTNARDSYLMLHLRETYFHIVKKGEDAVARMKGKTSPLHYDPSVDRDVSRLISLIETLALMVSVNSIVAYDNFDLWGAHIRPRLFELGPQAVKAGPALFKLWSADQNSGWHLFSNIPLFLELIGYKFSDVHGQTTLQFQIPELALSVSVYQASTLNRNEEVELTVRIDGWKVEGTQRVSSIEHEMKLHWKSWDPDEFESRVRAHLLENLHLSEQGFITKKDFYDGPIISIPDLYKQSNSTTGGENNLLSPPDDLPGGTVVPEPMALEISRAAADHVALLLDQQQGWGDTRPENRMVRLIPFKMGTYSSIDLFQYSDGQIFPLFILETLANISLERAEVLDAQAQNFSYYHENGRTRYLPETYPGLARYFPELGVTTFVHQFFEGFDELGIGNGQVRRWVASPGIGYQKIDYLPWMSFLMPPKHEFIPFSNEEAPEVLAEVLAAITYHYEPETDGGTTLSRIYFNNGDFVYKKDDAGHHQIKMVAAREKKGGVSINEFIFSLIQLPAVEDLLSHEGFTSAGSRAHSKVPVTISNPAVAFHGLERGLRYLYEDLGLPGDPKDQVRKWLTGFSKSELGRPYESFVQAYLKGELPLEFGIRPEEGQPRSEDLDREIERLKHIRDERGEELSADEIEALEERIAIAETRLESFQETRQNHLPVFLLGVTFWPDSFILMFVFVLMSHYTMWEPVFAWANKGFDYYRVKSQNSLAQLVAGRPTRLGLDGVAEVEYLDFTDSIQAERRISELSKTKSLKIIPVQSLNQWDKYSDYPNMHFVLDGGKSNVSSLLNLLTSQGISKVQVNIHPKAIERVKQSRLALDLEAINQESEIEVISFINQIEVSLQNLIEDVETRLKHIRQILINA